jgi:hypothetical protein
MKRMRQKPLVVFFAIPILLLLAWMFSSVLAQSNRTCVCHIENKKSGAGHVIEVDADSLQGHLRHGDTQCTVDCDTVLNEKCNVSTGGACEPAQ